jgi:hypothetical protein
MNKKNSRRNAPQKLFYTKEYKQKIISEVFSGKFNKRQA